MASPFDLPSGKTCRDCLKFDYCKDMYHSQPTHTVCHYYPSAFKQKHNGTRPRGSKQV